MALSRQSMRVGGVAGLVLAELPERLALADPAPAVHALRHGRGDPLGGDQQRRQRRGRLLGAVAQRRAPRRRRQRPSAAWRGRSLRRDHLSGAAICVDHLGDA